MAIGDPYITWPQLKKVLGVTDTSEDDLGIRACAGATTAIDNRSGFSTFWKTAGLETRTVPTEGRIVPKRRLGYYKLLLPDGIASSAGFAAPSISGAALIGSDQIARGRPVTEIKLPWSWALSDEVSITAIWGWPEVPADIIFACQMQAHRYYRRRGSPEGIAGSAEWGLSRVPNLDPDVKAILESGPYMGSGIG